MISTKLTVFNSTYWIEFLLKDAEEIMNDDIFDCDGVIDDIIKKEQILYFGGLV